MFIEIVTSCWHYPRALAFHLSGLVTADIRPGDQVRCVVFFCEGQEDLETVRVLEWFIKRIGADPQRQILPLSMPRRQLMRRAIARNLAATTTRADWLVFTDVDYIYGGQSLVSIAGELDGFGDRRVLCYTPHVRQSICHAAGDAELARVDLSNLALLRLGTDYESKPIARPIGGSQIVPGSVAREFGYCPASRHQSPADNWCRTFEDVEFRSILTRSGIPIIPLSACGVHRIRHSERGRENVGCRN